jgi:hypothetical protein
LVDIIIYQRCDPEKLTPKRIQALNSEWEAIAAFRAAAEKIAASIPEGIQDPMVLKRRMKGAVDQLFKQWKRDKLNLSNYVRELFGQGSLSEPAKLIGKVAEKAAGESVAGALVGGVTTHSLLGAGAGCAVGLMFHAGTAYQKVRQKEKEGPLRYLTMLHKEGVSLTISG